MRKSLLVNQLRGIFFEQDISVENTIEHKGGSL